MMFKSLTFLYIDNSDILIEVRGCIKKKSFGTSLHNTNLVNKHDMSANNHG
jgi:hypothetical protein